MMDVLSREESASEALFHEMSVLKDPKAAPDSIWEPDLHVSVGRDVPPLHPTDTALDSGSARSRAAQGVSVAPETVKVLSAVSAAMRRGHIAVTDRAGGPTLKPFVLVASAAESPLLELNGTSAT